jgi:hypothetical protein
VPNRTVRIAAALVALTAAACGRSPSTVTDDLQRDLDLASTPGVELAPTKGRVDVVSAIEQGKAGEAAKAAEPKATPRATPKRAQSAPRVAVRAPAPRAERAEPAPAPVREPVVEAPTVIAETPAPAEEPTPTVTRAPSPVLTTPIPSTSPRGRQRGGTWTMGDVIRNAPFPINP